MSKGKGEDSVSLAGFLKGVTFEAAAREVGVELEVSCTSNGEALGRGGKNKEGKLKRRYREMSDLRTRPETTQQQANTQMSKKEKFQGNEKAKGLTDASGVPYPWGGVTCEKCSSTLSWSIVIHSSWSC
ncbi:unnamed protein product [Heligmosomoides polygyrus]|uniref:G-patch domain-containing protein n=1 Tax=Heligmosomoides polygyrus TaxID=6339 RepID=A0A183G511_HELPZ|nr:unnamed protein product [Heligmosomoides polygyrus]